MKSQNRASEVVPVAAKTEDGRRGTGVRMMIPALVMAGFFMVAQPAVADDSYYTVTKTQGNFTLKIPDTCGYRISGGGKFSISCPDGFGFSLYSVYVKNKQGKVLFKKEDVKVGRKWTDFKTSAKSSTQKYTIEVLAGKAWSKR